MHAKEILKIYGDLAEVLESRLVPHLLTITPVLTARLKKQDLQDYVAKTFGRIIHNTVHTIVEIAEASETLLCIIHPVFDYFSLSGKSA
jgi:hypothetical protein